MTDSNSLRVLVVEDDADTRLNLCDILELDDCRVATAATMAEALEYRNWQDLDAVILDRKLPDGTAEELLPRIKQLAPDAQVIVATGHADLGSAIAALRLGAADYILKPINPEALRASLLRLAERRRLAVGKSRAETELRHEKEFVERLLANAQAIVLVLDTRGRIVRFNPFMEKLSGYRLRDVVDRDYFDAFVPEKDRARARGLFAERLQNSGAGGAMGTIVTKAGLRREIRWSSQVLNDGADERTYLLMVGHDMTDFNDAQRKALQAERLAAIGQMMTGLTHESRNALQRSKSCLEMLALEVEDRPEALDLVHRIENAQHHLQRLYEEVRAYAAPINLRRERCSLGDVWREVWSQLSPSCEAKHLRLREDLQVKDLTCKIDTFAIGQVFRNIIENSLAVSPENGEIVIRCTSAECEGRPALQVEVRDSGPGLSPEQRERIFEPFYTTKTKGTGLGMAIARRIIQSHGGTIDVGNHSAPGAEIVITLPRDIE